MTQSFYERFKDLTKGQLGECLVDACTNNRLEEVRYLLTSPELKRHANIHVLNDSSLIQACANGHFEIVKYLLTSPELKEHACIQAEQNQSIKMACRNQHLEIFKYLLTSSDLQRKVDIHAHKDSIFILAVKFSRFEFIQYMLFDLNIDLTNPIKGFLHNRTTPTIDKVKHMFRMRELNQKLTNDLDVENKVQTKKVKI
jgi:hypothetical protein